MYEKVVSTHNDRLENGGQILNSELKIFFNSFLNNVLFTPHYSIFETMSGQHSIIYKENFLT